MRIVYMHIWFILGLILLFSCQDPRQGTLSPETRTELDRLADQIHRDTEEKYHFLLGRLADVLQEALNKERDQEMLEHLRKFTRDNELALQTLNQEIDKWYKTLTEEDRNEFLIRMVAEDYNRRLRRLVPRFENRAGNRRSYQQVFDDLFAHVELRR